MKKTIDLPNKSELTYGRGYVYSLQYHVVWCTKYRKNVFCNGIDERCKDLLLEMAQRYLFTIVAMDVMSDHIHLLLDCKPQFMISDMIKILKGSIARRLFLDYPELKKQLWDGHLWNPSYCAVIASERSNEQVAHYIHTQKQEPGGTSNK